ncbi:MAG: GyrI-like domain-containing protein [Candidatus Thermoplasmatota archaeon]
MEARVAELKERWVCVVAHHGDPAAIDETRRPLYRHMILQELVGGPSILRWLERPVGDRVVDALVQTHAGFDGDELCKIERIPAGRFAVLDYEGPEADLAEARTALRDWARQHRLEPTGPLLQVHLMDAIDGITEQQLQLPVR